MGSSRSAPPRAGDGAALARASGESPARALCRSVSRRPDALEIRDLAGSERPEHRDALLRLRAALDTWMTETGDPGGWPEPPEVMAPFVEKMDAWFGTPEWAQAAAGEAGEPDTR